MTIPDIVGLVGIACVLVCYFLVQAGRMEARSVVYQVTNMAGCVLILYSLAYSWNLPSAIIQIIWFTISAFGLFRNVFPVKTSPLEE